MSLAEKWPAFLADLLEFQKIAEAQQPEFDEAANTVNEFHSEFSIFTVTEYGARRWEEILGIKAALGDTLEVRRSRIQTRYLSQLPYTYRSLLRYLSQLSQDYLVNLDCANYELYVSIRLTGYAQRAALMAVLAHMLPANILLQLQVSIPQRVRTAPVIPAAVLVRTLRRATRPLERSELT